MPFLRKAFENIAMAKVGTSAEECRKLGGCATGKAKITKCYRLPAKWVIHTVGPIWQGGDRNEAELLRQATASSLRKAEEMKLRSIALPAISSGIFGFPKEHCA